jgi:hypothetical protein
MLAGRVLSVHLEYLARAMSGDLDIPTAHALVERFEMLTQDVSGSPAYAPVDHSATPLMCVEGLHACNMFQWRTESQVRDRRRPDSVIVRLKREIDVSNIARHGHVERYDGLCTALLKIPPAVDATWDGLAVNSETLGQIADRLSIFTLKLAHFKECTNDGAMLIAIKQREYLTVCYDRFLRGLENGEAYMLAFQQLKVYAGSEVSNG